MTDKLELKSSHEVVYTVNVADVESIFYCKPTDPDILTVLMKDGKRLYCDEVCPVDSLQEDLVNERRDIFDNSLKSEEKFILPQKISGNINCENCQYSSACALGDIQACIIDKPVSEDLQEVPCNHCQGFNDKEKCDDLVFGHNCPIVKKPVSVWHDSNKEQPDYASSVAIWNPKYKNGEIISRCTEVYSDRIWAYIDDLLKM